MKFSPENYRRDTMVEIMRNQSKVNGEDKLRKVRGMREGIFYEIKTEDGWVRRKMNQKEIDQTIMELYG